MTDSFPFCSLPHCQSTPGPRRAAHLIPTIDVVIEALGGSVDMRIIGLTIFNAVATTAHSTPPSGSSKLPSIYTSGMWVHGSSTKEVVSDTTPLVNPNSLVAWRPVVEQALLEDDRVNGIVIRPALLYGKSGFLCWIPCSRQPRRANGLRSTGNPEDGFRSSMPTISRTYTSE